MEPFFRVAAIIGETAILTAIIFSVFLGIRLVFVDLGLDQKYHQFIKLILMILGFLALIFFISHLIAFYPGISL